MDCRKARYFLVVSFDETLPEQSQTELAHHLRGCRACRHESFYYRELFSAERQVPVRLPRENFNERLIAEIRLREARSAWPVETPRRSFRWPLVYVPALFGAAAIAGFLFFLPEQPAPSPVMIATTASAPASVGQVTADPHRPRYVLVPRAARTPSATLLYEWPSDGRPTGAAVDPFRRVLASEGSYLRNRRPRFSEQYVLPVVTQTVERDRIY
jgi:hypothetical protein